MLNTPWYALIRTVETGLALAHMLTSTVFLSPFLGTANQYINDDLWSVCQVAFSFPGFIFFQNILDICKKNP